MILAPNLQQLLSGNKNIVFIFLPILLFSCGAFKKIVKSDGTNLPETSDSAIIVLENHPDKDTISTTDPDLNAPTETYEIVDFKGEVYKVPKHKREFEIAVLLPFHVGAKKYAEKLRSDYMLEYLQGINVALERLNDLGSKYKIYVYDTKNDTSVLKRLLGQSSMEHMDLIIGPTDQTQVRIAAYYARKHNIPLFSPITVIDDAIISNPYLYNLNPSDELKAKSFISFFKKYHGTKQLVVVRDGKRFDKSFGEALIRELEAQRIANYKVVSFNKSQEWSKILSAGENLVLLTSEDKNTVNYSITGLVPLHERVTVIASDKWLDFTSVDYGFWNKLNVHFMGSALQHNQSIQNRAMRLKYRELYNGDPSSFAYAGHDHMLFAAELLDAFGEYFSLFVMQKSFEYSNNSFYLTPAHHCNHNKFLSIVEFRDNELIPVTGF